MYHSEILPLSFKLQKRPGHCPCRARRTLPSPMKSTTGPTVAAKLVGTNSQHAGIILGIGDSPQQAKSVQVAPEHCLPLPSVILLLHYLVVIFLYCERAPVWVPFHAIMLTEAWPELRSTPDHFVPSAALRKYFYVLQCGSYSAMSQLK